MCRIILIQNHQSSVPPCLHTQSTVYPPDADRHWNIWLSHFWAAIAAHSGGNREWQKKGVAFSGGHSKGDPGRESRVWTWRKMEQEWQKGSSFSSFIQHLFVEVREFAVRDTMDAKNASLAQWAYFQMCFSEISEWIWHMIPIRGVKAKFKGPA